MSLSPEVGILSNNPDSDDIEYWRVAFGKMNEVLSELGLPNHIESETLPDFKSRSQILGFPYGAIHHLRRFYAYAKNVPGWTPTPVPPFDEPWMDPVVEDEASMLESHLICHSDTEGFYLPIDFKKIVIDKSGRNRIPGELLGSSHQLHRELVSIAGPLGIRLDGDQLSDAEADQVNSRCDRNDPFATELMVWLCLFEACRISVELRTAVVLC